MTPRFSTVPAMRSPSRSELNVSFVRATPRSARCCWCSSSAIECANSRLLATDPVYSRANADCRVRTLKRRTSTRTPVAVFCTVPMTTPSALTSRQRSNGTSLSEVAGGIVLMMSRGISANSRSKFRSSQSTLADRFGGIHRFGVGRPSSTARGSPARRTEGGPGLIAADRGADVARLLRRRGCWQPGPAERRATAASHACRRGSPPDAPPTRTAEGCA